MNVSICVNQPGCLPDSENYPFTFEGNPKEIASVLAQEFELSETEFSIYPIMVELYKMASGKQHSAVYDLDDGCVLEVINIKKAA